VAGRDVSRRGGETRAEVAERACDALDDLPMVDVTVIVTHSATAMALCAALLGLPQEPHVLGPLANCHWTELRSDSRWQLRAHNAGPPGPVIPRLAPDEDVPDAEA
jgi:probable phosphoglycerate mutase